MDKRQTYAVDYDCCRYCGVFVGEGYEQPAVCVDCLEEIREREIEMGIL